MKARNLSISCGGGPGPQFGSVHYMRERSRSFILPSIWALAGVAAGASAALLWMGDFESDWVEATGTWFGAIVTVLALFWAVQTFRADQAHRDAERSDKEWARLEALDAQAEATREAELQAEAAVLAEASEVVIWLEGGAGQGSAPELQLTSVWMNLVNDTSGPVTIESFELDPPLVAKRYPAFPIRIKSHEAERIHVDVHLIDIDSNELSGRPLTRFTATTTYRLDRRTWTRTSAEDSTPVPAE